MSESQEVVMDAKRQDIIVATARMVQGLEDVERVLDNVMGQAALAECQGIIDDVTYMKKRIAKVKYSAFTAWLPPLDGTYAGWKFEEAQKPGEEA